MRCELRRVSLGGGRRCEMTTIPHEPSKAVQEPVWTLQLRVPEMWASLAIAVMWLSVLFATIFGPDIEVSTYLGDHTTVPSAVVLAPFAFLATWVVAKYGFPHERKSD
jgi:hypothetical protein